MRETPKINVIKIWQTLAWPTVFICVVIVSVFGRGVGTSSSEAQGSLQMSDDDHPLRRRKTGLAFELEAQNWEMGRSIWESCLQIVF